MNTAQVHKPDNAFHGMRVIVYIQGKSCGIPDKPKLAHEDVWITRALADLEPAMQDASGTMEVSSWTLLALHFLRSEITF